MEGSGCTGDGSGETEEGKNKRDVWRRNNILMLWMRGREKSKLILGFLAGQAQWAGTVTTNLRTTVPFGTCLCAVGERRREENVSLRLSSLMSGRHHLAPFSSPLALWFLPWSIKPPQDSFWPLSSHSIARVLNKIILHPYSSEGSGKPLKWLQSSQSDGGVCVLRSGG